MHLRLCLGLVFALIYSIASCDAGLPRPPSNSSDDGFVKFHWLTPTLANKTEFQQHANNFDDIIWPHFEQILFWLQQPEEKIYLNVSALRALNHQAILLRRDLLTTYEIKCMKATAEPYIFENANRDFKICLRSYFDYNFDDAQSVIDHACRDLGVPSECMEIYKSKLSRCLNADEMEAMNSVQRIVEKFLRWNCDDSGYCFVSLMAGKGNLCIRTHIDAIKLCSKEFQHIFPIQDDTIQFKLRIGYREKLFQKSWCIVAALDECVDPTAMTFYASLFDIIHDQTEFIVPIWHIMFICFVICVALSFFVCVFLTRKSAQQSDKHAVEAVRQFS